MQKYASAIGFPELVTVMPEKYWLDTVYRYIYAEETVGVDVDLLEPDDKFAVAPLWVS